jgi:peptidoglycan hydrolase CwlO-like protein
VTIPANGPGDLWSVDDMRSWDVALRLSIVFAVAALIALAASLYEVDRRDKSSSETAAATLTDLEQQVQILGDQIRILSNQLDASERQTRTLGSQIQGLDLRLKQLEENSRGRR